MKLATILRRPLDALEAGSRLAKRAPLAMWQRRETTPSRVAFALAILAPAPNGDDQEPWLRVIDQLVSQGVDAEDRESGKTIRKALLKGAAIPPPSPPHDSTIQLGDDVDLVYAAICTAYREGSLREDDLVLDQRLGAVWAKHSPGDVLRIRRDF